MGFPKVEGQNSEYTTVIFNDKGNNNKKVSYDIPIGAIINTTNQSFEVKADGVYSNGKKIENLEVMLANHVALDVFDKNDDGKIDNKDQNAFATQNNSVAKEIDDKLKSHSSAYCCLYGAGEDHAAVDNTGFYATFHKGITQKHFSIELPKENEAQKKSFFSFWK